MISGHLLVGSKVIRITGCLWVTGRFGWAYGMEFYTWAKKGYQLSSDCAGLGGTVLFGGGGKGMKGDEELEKE